MHIVRCVLISLSTNSRSAISLSSLKGCSSFSNTSVTAFSRIYCLKARYLFDFTIPPKFIPKGLELSSMIAAKMKTWSLVCWILFCCSLICCTVLTIFASASRMRSNYRSLTVRLSSNTYMRRQSAMVSLTFSSLSQGTQSTSFASSRDNLSASNWARTMPIRQPRSGH